MRGDQISRQWRILRQLESSRAGLTAAEIAEAGGASLRTAYRDLEDLQASGFPLYCEEEEAGRRWKLVDSFTTGIPVPFTLTELMALHLGRDLFRVLKGTEFYDSMESLFEKHRAILAPETLAFLDRLSAAFHTGIRPYRNYARFREMVHQVNRAVVKRRRVEIVYQGLRSEKETVRKLDPFAVWLYDGTIYVVGYCHLRGEVRMFVVDRIRMLKDTDQSFEKPADFDLHRHVRHSFKVMTDELYTVRIWISPAWARYVSERIWHESQHIQKQVDGAVEISFRVAGLEEIKQWVLSLGPEARVIEPPELICDIADSLSQTKRYYEGMELQQPAVAENTEGYREGRLWG